MMTASASQRRSTTVALYGGTTDQVAMSAAALPSVGGGQAHENRQPYLGINYIIALVGTYPSRG